MYDEQGRAYLDAYNNVPVVGHCHPYVVDALTRQARTLNTHTRYSPSCRCNSPRNCCATMPPELGNVVFTCTGSEANDLAVRVSKAVTGGTGFIITDFSYHGVTDVLSGMSPEDGGPLGPGVYTVPSPAAAGGAAAFGEHVRDSVERMRSDGVRLAASAHRHHLLERWGVRGPQGISRRRRAPRAGGRRPFRRRRGATGLRPARRSDVGLSAPRRRCRTSSRWASLWATDTRSPPSLRAPRSLPRFAKRRHYFNTYGGNSVSCAAALAVLHVIRNRASPRERPPHRRVSQARPQQHSPGDAPRLARCGAPDCSSAWSCTANPVSGLAGSAETKRVVNAMRRRGVLSGLNRPPRRCPQDSLAADVRGAARGPAARGARADPH